MEDHNLLSDTALEHQFEITSLSPKALSHEAHLRLAWIHIKRYGIEQAIKNLCAQLREYTEAVGAADKYNETVTVAATRAMYHFMQRTKADNFQDFIQEFPQLKNNLKGLLRSHYGYDIYSSKKARETYLEPDLAPFE